MTYEVFRVIGRRADGLTIAYEVDARLAILCKGGLLEGIRREAYHFEEAAKAEGHGPIAWQHPILVEVYE